jgi:circadian clock protein KaiC
VAERRNRSSSQAPPHEEPPAADGTGAETRRKAAPYRPPRAEADEERIESGISRLDAILHGGLFKGGVYALYGPPGAGKTILANQLCFNRIAMSGGNCVYVTVLAESHAKMVRHLRGMRFYDATVVGSRLQYIAAYQTLKSEGIPGLTKLIGSLLASIRPSVMVIDGLETVGQIAGSATEAKEFLHQMQSFASLTNTTLLLCAVAQEGETRRDENATVDGVRTVGPAGRPTCGARTHRAQVPRQRLPARPPRGRDHQRRRADPSEDRDSVRRAAGKHRRSPRADGVRGG